ncbi:MAG: phage tail protein [Myxococcota bacterium]
MPMYTVKKGDWLQKIATANGLSSWTEIYNHPANAAFKKSHPNPNLIYPGDVVFVPEPPKKPDPPPPPPPPPPKVEPPKPPVVVPPLPKPPNPPPPKPKPAPPKAKVDTARSFDHQGAFRFRIEIEGIQVGAFTAVDGLNTTVELIEYQGGRDMFARQIPGRPKIAPVTLKKGYVNTAALWDWIQANMSGDLQFRNVSVILLADDAQGELNRFDLIDCWPSSWRGWQLDAKSSNAMVEEIELQVRNIQRN